METAAKILIVGGTLNLAAAFVIGFVISSGRIRVPERPVLPYLMNAHRVALWEGFMLLGLTFAVQLSSLGSGVETLAASLLTASSFFQLGSNVANLLMHVNDEFAARSLGLYMAVTNAMLASVGLGILIVGVFGAL